MTLLVAALVNFRCTCGALLARLSNTPGLIVQIKCDRCKAVNTFQAA